MAKNGESENVKNATHMYNSLKSCVENQAYKNTKILNQKVYVCKPIQVLWGILGHTRDKKEH